MKITLCILMDFHKIRLKILHQIQYRHVENTNSKHGSFSEARTMCKELGGDLLYKNLGPNGAQYHAILRNLIEDHSAHYWIGMTDIESDGNWNLLDGDAYDASDMTQKALYYWYPGQPNLDGHCVFIWSYPTQAYGLADFPCQNNVYDNKPVKGICEICES